MTEEDTHSTNSKTTIYLHGGTYRKWENVVKHFENPKKDKNKTPFHVSKFYDNDDFLKGIVQPLWACCNDKRYEIFQEFSIFVLKNRELDWDYIEEQNDEEDPVENFDLLGRITVSNKKFVADRKDSKCLMNIVSKLNELDILTKGAWEKNFKLVGTSKEWDEMLDSKEWELINQKTPE